MSRYYDEQELKNKQKLDLLRKELPPFLSEFFRSRTDHTSSRTRLAYAYDLRLFFNFLISETREIDAKSMDDFTLEHFGKITDEHIEEFLEYLGYYVTNRNVEGAEFHVENQTGGKARKLSTIRAVFAYFYKKGKVSANPAELVDMPPVREKAKVYLDVDEIADLLDMAEGGANLTKRQKDYHAHTRSRDVALLSLLAGTGIRVSELVGLNLNDVDVDRGSFRVVRKGGDEAILFFSEEIEMALREYLEIRGLKKGKIQAGHENALFLSMQNRRITARAVQNLVKKYSELAVSFKKITPHKLRSSFGTNMYRQTGDIYLVADLLGHKDVNTTRKSYADTKQEAGRRAAKAYRLRGDD
ncbi:MAG: tyrosine-type recombinase/integrase [Defluviitaleaceae bacterium]|nr:tyrosine-type recombinase/integrase [Defluviitaleaceae bacterium]